MNRHDYKRHNKIKEELAQLDQDFEDVLEEIRNYYVERNMKGIRVAEDKLQWVLREVNLRRTIDEEILLPKYVKTTWVGNEEDMPKDAEMEEHLAMFLTDNYNHNVYGFQWVVKGKNVFITSIRWNQHQLLKCDLKELLKGAISKIEIGDVYLIKNKRLKNTICLYDTREPNYESFSLNEAIKWLEEHYYL